MFECVEYSFDTHDLRKLKICLLEQKSQYNVFLSLFNGVRYSFFLRWDSWELLKIEMVKCSKAAESVKMFKKTKAAESVDYNRSEE